MTEPAVHTTHVDTIYFFGTSMRIMMSGAQTKGSFCLIEVRSPASCRYIFIGGKRKPWLAYHPGLTDPGL